MPKMPAITVQLVHIQGPLKGRISEFSEFPVHIGRHSSCHVCFGKDMTAISRQHARIEYEDTRFRIIDVSTNGTYINGKRIANVYLRDGDVITFSENGPKASFLTKIGAGSAVLPSSHKPTDSSLSSSLQPDLTLGADQEVNVLSSDVPLMIRHGQERRSFNLLPVTMGKGPDCDFVIPDPGLCNQHVQIFFSGGNYYAKDLTGKQLVLVNGRPIDTQAVIAQGAELSLTSHGPAFRFSGDGRLDEIQNEVVEPVKKSTWQTHNDEAENKESSLKKKSIAFIKKVFK